MESNLRENKVGSEWFYCYSFSLPFRSTGETTTTAPAQSGKQWFSGLLCLSALAGGGEDSRQGNGFHRGVPDLAVSVPLPTPQAASLGEWTVTARPINLPLSSNTQKGKSSTSKESRGSTLLPRRRCSVGMGDTARVEAPSESDLTEQKPHTKERFYTVLILWSKCFSVLVYD